VHNQPDQTALGIGGNSGKNVHRGQCRYKKKKTDSGRTVPIGGGKKIESRMKRESRWVKGKDQDGRGRSGVFLSCHIKKNFQRGVAADRSREKMEAKKRKRRFKHSR